MYSRLSVCLSVPIYPSIHLSIHSSIYLSLSLSLALSFARALSLSLYACPGLFQGIPGAFAGGAHSSVDPSQALASAGMLPAHILLILRVARMPMRGGLHGCENAVCVLSVSVCLFVCVYICA